MPQTKQFFTHRTITAQLPHNYRTISAQFEAVIVPREKKERNYTVAIVFSTRAYFKCIRARKKGCGGFLLP